MWIIFEVFLEFVTILLLFYVLGFFFPLRHVGSLLPDQGLNLHPLHLKGEDLTTGPPERSLKEFQICHRFGMLL